MDKELYVCPLGTPMPDDPHAVSVSMPHWADVVGYEENDPAVVSQLACGYPRFLYHDFYNKLCEKYAVGPGEIARAFPSVIVAEKCVAYVGAGHVRETADGIALAIIPKDSAAKAKEFWQHAGLIVSSRQAEAILSGRPPAPAGARGELAQCVARLYNTDEVWLYPSGMGAIFTAYEIVTVMRGTKTVQLGFPYLDTLKIQQKFGAGVYIPYNTPGDLGAIDLDNTAAVFCEIPGNPLLRTIDLPALKKLLAPRGIPLIIDDTLGPPMNVDLLPYADIIVTSLTKFFSGIGNVTGGSLVVNRASPHYAMFKKHLTTQHEELLYPDDAEVLLRNAQGFIPRMAKINVNAAKLAAYLRAHPEVKQVYYPGGPAYEEIRKSDGGYGGLLSFTVKDPANAPKVYDALAVAKGPSLGTEFTLASPYTLLAHYNELDWAAKSHVPSDLIRVSVGMESAEGIVARFEKALKI